MKRSIRVLALVLSLSAAALQAQVAGRLSGTVIDQTGAAVPNAKVSLLLHGGKIPIIATQTTSDGLFTISTVRPDLYDLAVEAQGFSKSSVTSVRIEPSKDTDVSIKLEVAATVESVQVTDTAPGAIQTNTAEVATTVTQAQIENLPVLDRQVAALFITQAGVTGDRTVTAINGMRSSYSNLLLDGVNIQDSVRTNALDFVPNRLTIGQVAEMTIGSSNLDPTIGGNATTISLTTPSGTNTFHGNAYFYNRNSQTAANDWFSNKNSVDRPFQNLNQLGGTIGGPIKKDKLLFFTNYEAYRDRQTSPQNRTILTPTARQGILQYRDASGTIRSFNLLTDQGLAADPAVQKMLSQMPTTGNNNQFGDGLNTTGYSFNARSNDVRDNVTGKLDYYLSTRHTFSGSYIWNRDIPDRPDQGTFYTSTPPIFNDDHNHFMSASWRWSPSATLTNELRGGFNLQTGSFVNSIGYPAYYLTGLLFDPPASQPQPENRNTNVYSIQDNANWVKGHHSFAFGFQASIWHTKDSIFINTIPSYGIGYAPNSPYGYNLGDIPGASSTDINTANNLLASIAGIVSGATQTFNPASKTSGFVAGAPAAGLLNMNNYAPYFRDSWKVRRNLTLTLGVRWEYFSPVDVANGLMIEPKLINGNAPATLLANSTLDFAPNPLYKRDLNNFAPSVGLAWDLFGNGKSVVRAAYSIAYANDNMINDIPNAIFFNVNNGLSTTVNLANLNAIVSKNLPSITAPAFSLPITTLQNFNSSPSSPPAQGLVDPNLATPYVQQYNFAVSQDVKGFVLEGRYVGNHVVKMLREIDYNQININQSTYLADFITARNNGFLAAAAGKGFNPTYNPAIAGSAPTPFFNSLPGGGLLTNATVASAIRSGQAGSLAQTYQGAGFLPNPNFSFFPNPYSLYSALLTNISNSSYNGLQLEVRKRTRAGLQFQANYTFSKSLSDALATRGIEAQLDNSNARLERARTPFDTTHSFKLNHFIPLPFGPGQRFHLANGFLNRLLGGWGLGGFLRIETGPPVSILSALGTLNRGSRSGNNTANTTLTLSQLQGITGLFMTGNGPYFVNPKNINPTNGQGVQPYGSQPFAGQVFFDPGPGTLGSLQRRNLDGPGFWMYDTSLIKTTRIKERQSIEFRADFYNVFNHPSFFVRDQNVNASTFGQITDQNYTNYGVGPRILQFGIMYKF